MQVTVTIPDDLAARLGPLSADLPHILALGLREAEAGDSAGFKGLADVLEFLASLPDPEQLLALRPSADLQDEIERLLEANRTQGLSPEDEWRWQQCQFIEHLVRKAKINAARRLAAA